MSVSAIDMELDDVIAEAENTHKGGGRKGKTKENKGWGKGSAKAAGGKTGRKNDEQGAKNEAPTHDKLDMSLDEVVQASWEDEKHKSEGSKGKGKSKNQGNESWGSSNRSASGSKNSNAGGGWNSGGSNGGGSGWKDTNSSKQKNSGNGNGWESWGSSKGGGGGTNATRDSWGSSKSGGVGGGRGASWDNNGSSKGGGGKGNSWESSKVGGGGKNNSWGAWNSGSGGKGNSWDTQKPSGGGKQNSWESSNASGGGKGNTWDNSKGSSGGKNNSWDTWKSSKGSSGGEKSNWTPPWNQHDDWRAPADEEGWNSNWKSGRESDVGGGGSWADRLSGGGEWRRVEQQEDEDDADAAPSPPPRRAPAASTGAKTRRVNLGSSRDVRARAEAQRGSSPAKVRRRAREDDPASGQGGRTKRIKVTNIARDLDEQDITEAFEPETGRIVKCVLENRTAFITFAKPEDARKAVEAFDQGELNGKTITATLDN
eukprot:TRINITY_DN76660_c0_g1_i1.p1 TRINITY_DN76660_c0_g1~~TRINITY_DN76660_c0_g1_i1.p1  ORF type:complete len:484 (-),score=102.16 TRINITY_DN76660_c0_g1_i1:191-1642(-)